MEATSPFDDRSRPKGRFLFRLSRGHLAVVTYIKAQGNGIISRYDLKHTPINPIPSRRNHNRMSSTADSIRLNIDEAPTDTWYTNNYESRDNIRWNHDTVAWVLNISQRDLKELQHHLIRSIALSENGLQDLDKGVKFSDIATCEYSCIGMAKRYPGVEVPKHWRRYTVSLIARQLRQHAIPQLIAQGSIDVKSGVSTDKDNLTRRDPTFLNELVEKPHELLLMMHDCEVLLSGSRATTFFWPGFDSSTSDWDFYVHPHLTHWLRFAVYLTSVGVKWNTSERDDDEPETYKGTVLNGKIDRKGREQSVQLISHAPASLYQSNIQPVLAFHSSIVQNFISGFGAVSMYGSLTRDGSSRTWEPKEWFDGAICEAHQAAVDKYVGRGVKYLTPQHPSTAPSKIPKPEKRSLADPSAVCVPFEEYIRQNLNKDTETSGLQPAALQHRQATDQARIDLVRMDFETLLAVEWREASSRLISRQYGEDSVFWRLDLKTRWAARAEKKKRLLSDMTEFSNLIAISGCPHCEGFQAQAPTCQEHRNTEVEYVNILLFYWSQIEQRRSWERRVDMYGDEVKAEDPRGRVVDWRDCELYPFI